MSRFFVLSATNAVRKEATGWDENRFYLNGIATLNVAREIVLINHPRNCFQPPYPSERLPPIMFVNKGSMKDKFRVNRQAKPSINL